MPVNIQCLAADDDARLCTSTYDEHARESEQQDAKTLFEDQISKLVLENQELEWEKASLQHQIETVTNQHTEALMNAQKQFQAKISNIEEEKGIFQISVELKDKEMINLKEAMKSLQMLKYNLEKKANELVMNFSTHKNCFQGIDECDKLFLHCSGAKKR
ncbi:coiled-coil domain-containing protein 73-like [Labrus bergylta]|uniref:coiled-coil domain-containing protein 73-like n=1 Tax=Labrus bergylta TaxID=56723 RepID=UPI003313ACF7